MQVQNVSRETISPDKALLAAFVDEVLRWQKAINLIAPNTIPDIWQRHIEDSSQIVEYIPHFGTNTSMIDMGSGGGFPGMVLACCGSGPIRMIESDQRKCQFLAQTARKLKLHQVEVINSRIESYTGDTAPVITARALAPLPKLLNWALPLLSLQDTIQGTTPGTMVFMKGANWQQELDQAQVNFDFTCEAKPSQTSADARILILTNVSRKES